MRKFYNIWSILSCLLASSITVTANADGSPFSMVTLTPTELKWMPAPMLPKGAEMTVLVGDPSKPGPYLMRIKFPAGYRVPLHYHPDDRMVTVMAGTVRFGYGDKYDDDTLKEMPTGSVFTEPAKQPHYLLMSAGEAVIQISATGPAGITYLNPADDQRKQ